MSRVGIVGLGLIGGSFAKAYHAAGWEVLASNRTKSTLDFAVLAGEVDGELTKENAGSCDLIL
ncbi:MAG: prephenate dehydrogenase/arogenate dehydrogenase family protein, partial [Oscillospiraceae bacterium]|nr:prephenate dehydrogenase/arogenate dehydrogenase family protein [Oscillospiraceae bacterium]